MFFPSSLCNSRTRCYKTRNSEAGNHLVVERGDRAECAHLILYDYSSGIPALRSPARYVASNKARIFGRSDANNSTALKREMLE